MQAHRLLAIALITGCASARPPVGPSAPSAPAVVPTGQVDSILASLSVRDRVDQLVVPWLAGSYTALDDSLFQVAARWVDTLEVGGLIISVGSPFDKIGRASCRER